MTIRYMDKTKVVVYGLSTEGYSLANKMAIEGFDVSIIDETTPSAISLKPEIAKTYPNVESLKEDEPLLGMEPIDLAISKSKYLFFTPRIRKTGQDTKTEIHSKFKDAVGPLKKGSSVIFNLPTGFGGNNENISLLSHVTGFEPGKSIHYYYFPLISDEHPEVIGSFQMKEDEKLLKLLGKDSKKTKFVSLPTSEYHHSINTLTKFSRFCSILEVCKFAQNESNKSEIISEKYQELFLDDLITGIYDLKALGSSFEGANNLMYLVNGSIKGIEGYIKRLIDEIRSTLKKNDLKASKTKIAIAWTLDQNSMRGEKIEMLQNLTIRLRDYISDVEAYEGKNFDMYHSDKTTIVVVCSEEDFISITKKQKESEIILIKTNPICEIIQKE